MEDIINKYLEDTATDSEKKELLAWLRNRENRKAFFFHRSVWEKRLGGGRIPAAGGETWQRIQSGLLERSCEGWQKSRRLMQFLRYAAIFFFLTTLGFSLLWVLQGRRSGNETVTRVMADNGQISRAGLPDGTQVWINSGSAISYDSDFGVKNREVRLTGEAYFEAHKGNRLPLVVNCGELLVRVTGTRFNVSALPGSPNIDVVLEEGSVELLREQNTSFHYTLKPGEMASFDLSRKKMTVTTVNTHRITSWKEGMINIYDQPLEEVALKLRSRYNQEFVVDPGVKEYHYTFSISKESLQEIIALIEKITPVKAVQEGNVITFGPKKQGPGRGK
ncbi:MAG TPA: FecR domain-containing protein [Prolixibacteraceae bacterium]|nr:FecR domain-containing protein [Prolixibacteraceae bacterium]